MRSVQFRWLFANGFFSTGSRWALVLARGWLVHDLSGGSTAAVGWVTFASLALATTRNAPIVAGLHSNTRGALGVASIIQLTQ